MAGSDSIGFMGVIDKLITSGNILSIGVYRKNGDICGLRSDFMQQKMIKRRWISEILTFLCFSDFGVPQNDSFGMIWMSLDFCKLQFGTVTR